MKTFVTLIAAAAAFAAPPCSESRDAMPARALGRTGFRTAIFGLGGQSVIETPGREEDAERIINTALDLGVNYIDTAPRYGNGTSEANIGRVMKYRRQEVFLATKSHYFCYEGTMELIQGSLERLQTNYIDLYQHHGVHTGEELERIAADDGALAAFLELKAKGVVGNIGITSHSPLILMKALESEAYDCMLITLNPAGEVMEDREHLGEFMRMARAQNVGVVAMKILCRGALLKEGVGMNDLFGYALSHPVASAVIGISELWQVYDNVENAMNFRHFSEDEKGALERRFGAEIPRGREEHAPAGGPGTEEPPPGCFIASAAYGCPRSEKALFFADLRDSYLSKNAAGRMIVSAYYSLSPRAALAVESNPAARKIIRLHLNSAAGAARLLRGTR